MDTHKYEVLLQVLEAGSISGAAARTGYTQSGVTHMLRSIEREWGTVLFTRTHTGVVLTPEGKRIMPYVREICGREHRLQEELHAMHGLQVGQIRVGAFMSISTHFLPQAISCFSKKYPGIEFDIRQGNYTEIEGWLLDGSVDIGFLPQPVNPKLSAVPLMTDRMLVVLPPDHPLADCERIEPPQLAREPFILLDVSVANHIESIFRSHHVELQVYCRLRDGYAALSMVELGLGISMMYELFLQRPTWHVEVREMNPPAFREIAAVCPHGTGLSRLVRAFLQQLSQSAHQMSGRGMA